MVGTVGRHVQQGGDPNGVQDLSFRGVEGAAEVEEREDLDRATLEHIVRISSKLIRFQ